MCDYKKINDKIFLGCLRVMQFFTKPNFATKIIANKKFDLRIKLFNTFQKD